MPSRSAYVRFIKIFLTIALVVFWGVSLNLIFAYNGIDNTQATDPCPTSTDVKLPQNISAPKMLRPLLEKIFLASPTFRRQCEEIDRARHVKIYIRLLRAHHNKGYRAISNVKRYEGGLLEIRMELLVPNDLVELIGHEFEHVLEQIEQIDLEAKIFSNVSDTSRNHDGSFETDRAIEAGRKVRMEFKNRSAIDI